MMRETKLIPCPFCGGKKVDLWPVGRNAMGGTWESPVCSRCGATIHENFGTAEDTKAMVAAWNRRVEKSGD